MIKPSNLFITLFLTFNFFYAEICFAENELMMPVSDNAEISVERFPASGKHLILWLAPEYGLRAAHRVTAKMLSQKNIEVWQSNIAESLFLPRGSTTLKNLDGNYVADLIEYAYKTTGKKIIVAGDSYAALNALTGAHQWQQRQHKTPYFIGAILFTPNTYSKIPPLGQLPQYMPIVSATNIPLIIYQGKNSSNAGQFKTLIEKLQQHGNPVYTRITPKVASLFYEDNITDEMREQIKFLPDNIRKMISILEKHKVPSTTIPLKISKENKRGIDIHLKEYKGQARPIAISLNNANGSKVEKKDYKGQVTIINFWATWCTPCIEEIPSLNRLNKKMQGLPFELISINYAEDKQTIRDFMKKVEVEFPVLLDPEGAFANKWNVIAYPSTFVIGKDGEIKYGVNAAIEWDDPEVVARIKSLLEKQ
jgi:thiol-disulfide isomerase/thioredoxin